MTLKDYLYYRRIPQNKFAKSLGILPSNLSHYINDDAPIPERLKKPIEALLGTSLQRIESLEVRFVPANSTKTDRY